jgi:hypothetical protein
VLKIAAEEKCVKDGGRGKVCQRWRQRKSVSKMAAEEKCVKDGGRGKVCQRRRPRKSVSKMAAQRAGRANLPRQKFWNTCAKSLKT